VGPRLGSRALSERPIQPSNPPETRVIGGDDVACAGGIQYGLKPDGFAVPVAALVGEPPIRRKSRASIDKWK
jgi:hypothetical protein